LAGIVLLLAVLASLLWLADRSARLSPDFLTGFVLYALSATNLIGTTVGEEITTFDYGHFNGYPFTIDPSVPSGGAVFP